MQLKEQADQRAGVKTVLDRYNVVPAAAKKVKNTTKRESKVLQTINDQKGQGDLKLMNRPSKTAGQRTRSISPSEAKIGPYQIG